MNADQDRHGATVKGKHIAHATLVKLWVCGECGSRLKTVYRDGWYTVCSKDPEHSKIMHRDAYAHVAAREQDAAIKAADILSHLPADLQAEIQRP